MLRTFLHAKLHRVTVTQSELHYEGSCAIDEDLLDASGIRPFEAIDIYNVTTGARFSTYAIRAERASGTISVNGAAARLAAPGDLLIVAAYAQLSSEEVACGFNPRLVYVDARNRMTGASASIPVQSS